MQKFIFTSLSVLVFAGVSVFGQQTKINVQKGQKYMVETTTKLTSSAEVMGQTMENNSDIKSTTIYEITKAEESEIKL